MPTGLNTTPRSSWLKKLAVSVSTSALALGVGIIAAPAAHADESSLGSAGSLGSLSLGSSLGSSAPDSTPAHDFDLQSHRGGRGEWTEESGHAFEQSLKLDVTTLELDIVLAEDNTPVVWHDPSIQEDKCSDTEPATPNDPEFPYVGKLVHELNWDQLQTLNCDKKLSGFPDAEPVEGNKLLQLQDVFDIAAADPQVRFNIETKIEAENREDSATPEEFVNTIVSVIQQNNAVDRSAIQSFDWRSLPLAHQAAPELDIVALYDETTWKANSVWIDPINYDDVHGDVVAAAEQLGANVLSPNFKLVNQQNVQWAHQRGIQVIPWTVNESDDINRIIDTGVDGLITDYPTRATEILNSRGITIA